MMTAIVSFFLSFFHSAPVAQFRPCVWPNTCATQQVAQFETCVWPKRCVKAA